MKQRVVLYCRQRQFEDLADEERKNSTTPALLGIEMRNIRDRHVMADVQSMQPFCIPVHAPSAVE